MKLFMNGIYRNTNSVVLIEELKRAGYVEVEEPVKEKPALEPVIEGGDLASEANQEVEPEKVVLSPEEKKALREAKKAGK